MHRYLLTILVAGGVLGLLLGCGGSAEKADQAETQAESTPAETQTADTRTPASTEMAQATVQGKLGCGHCTYDAINTCSLALKTADGEIMLIEAGDRQEELMAVRYDQPEVKIDGRVTEVEGMKVIYTDSVLLQ